MHFAKHVTVFNRLKLEKKKLNQVDCMNSSWGQVISCPLTALDLLFRMNKSWKGRFFFFLLFLCLFFFTGFNSPLFRASLVTLSASAVLHQRFLTAAIQNIPTGCFSMNEFAFRVEKWPGNQRWKTKAKTQWIVDLWLEASPLHLYLDLSRSGFFSTCSTWLNFRCFMKLPDALKYSEDPTRTFQQCQTLQDAQDASKKKKKRQWPQINHWNISLTNESMSNRPVQHVMASVCDCYDRHVLIALNKRRFNEMVKSWSRPISCAIVVLHFRRFWSFVLQPH